MGVVDSLTKDPIGEYWPQSELNEKTVFYSKESFHKVSIVWTVD